MSIGNRRSKVVYIAGPYRAPTERGVIENIRRAEAAALLVWRHGYVALCPHLNTAMFGGALPDGVWLEGDRTLLARCDAVLTVEGWKFSIGASAEVHFANERGIPVVGSVEALERVLP